MTDNLFESLKAIYLEEKKEKSRIPKKRLWLTWMSMIKIFC